jgi:hypothetical protein
MAFATAALVGAVLGLLDYRDWIEFTVGPLAVMSILITSLIALRISLIKNNSLFQESQKSNNDNISLSEIPEN